jgi:hypothetical protein
MKDAERQNAVNPLRAGISISPVTQMESAPSAVSDEACYRRNSLASRRGADRTIGAAQVGNALVVEDIERIDIHTQKDPLSDWEGQAGSCLSRRKAAIIASISSKLL